MAARTPGVANGFTATTPNFGGAYFGINAWTHRRLNTVNTGGKLLRRPLQFGLAQSLQAAPARNTAPAFAEWWWLTQPLTASFFVAASGRPALAGTAPLKARATALASGRSGPVPRAALVGSWRGQASLRARPAGTAALSATSTAMASRGFAIASGALVVGKVAGAHPVNSIGPVAGGALSQFPPLGAAIVQLSARLTAMASAAGVLSGSAALVALVGAAKGMATGRGTLTGSAALATRVRAQASGRARLSGSARLAARLTAIASSRSSPIGRAALSAFVRAQAAIRAPLAGVAAFSATVRGQASGRPSIAGTAYLSARAFAQATVRAGITGSASLTVFAFAMASAAARLAAEVKHFVDPRFVSGSRARRDVTADDLRTAFTASRPRRFLSSRKRQLYSAARIRRFVTTPKVTGVHLPQGNDFSTADTNETVNLTFDFGPWLPTGVTISEVGGVTCSPYEGTDEDASTRLVGDASVVSSPSTGAANTAVLQQFGNAPIAGVTYRIDVVVATSDGQTLNLWAHQPVQSPD